MFKGLVSGVIWGTLLGGVFLVVVSLITPLRGMGGVQAASTTASQAQPEAEEANTTAEESSSAEPDTPSESPDTESSLETETTVEAETPVVVADTPAEVPPEPETNNAAPISLSEAISRRPAVIAEAPTAAEPVAPATPPAVDDFQPEPEPEPEPEPPAEPEPRAEDAQPTQPEPAEPSLPEEGPEPNTAVEEDVASETTEQPETPSEPVIVEEEAPTPEATTEEPVSVAESESAATTEAPQEEASITPEPEPEPRAEEPTPVSEPASQPVIEPEQPQIAEAEPEEETAPQEEEAPPPSEEDTDVVASAPSAEVETAPPQPTVGFGNRTPNVRINRLPSIGGAEPATEAETTSPEAEQDANQENLPALERFAVPFENQTGQPLLSIVLIDIGPEADGLAISALKTFPFPVTFAVPADRPDAAEAAATYRSAGFEVVMLASGIPAGATPVDVETTFGVYRGVIPEAVAVMDTPEGGFQNERRQAQQVVSILKESGQGLLSFNQGLNAADRIALREGLPSATVFREIDPEGDDQEAIQRTLDRSVLRAGQEGAVIVLGSTRDDTVSALFGWALEGKSEEVALAPISAIFRAKQ